MHQFIYECYLISVVKPVAPVIAAMATTTLRVVPLPTLLEQMIHGTQEFPVDHAVGDRNDI